MSHFTNDLTLQYLDKLYDDLTNEHHRLMQELKSSAEPVNEKEKYQLVSIINSISMSVIKLKNIKRKLANAS
jgi:hypothetical protein